MDQLAYRTGLVYPTNGIYRQDYRYILAFREVSCGSVGWFGRYRKHFCRKVPVSVRV